MTRHYSICVGAAVLNLGVPWPVKTSRRLRGSSGFAKMVPFPSQLKLPKEANCFRYELWRHQTFFLGPEFLPFRNLHRPFLLLRSSALPQVRESAPPPAGVLPRGKQSNAIKKKQSHYLVLSREEKLPPHLRGSFSATGDHCRAEICVFI